MSEQVNEYPPYLDYPKPRKKQTNADRIRAMTDEELARVIAYACDCDLVSGFSCHGKCCDCILDWLKQEAEE